MILENIGPETAFIKLTKAELLVINACINEVCNGIDTFEFETRIGANLFQVKTLLSEMNKLLDQME